MIHIVTRGNSAFYQRELSRFFELRREIFVEERGWHLATTGGEERDEYDDDQAVYVLNIDSSGDVVAGQRLRSTLTNSMLADKFPNAVAIKDRPIADERTWEVTRGFVIPALRGSAHGQSRAAFRLGTLEAAQQFGIDRMLGITEVQTLPWFFNMGYHIRLIGLPIPTGETSSVAFEIAINPQAIAHMREVWALEAPSTFALDPLSRAPADLDAVAAHLIEFASVSQAPVALRAN